MMQKLSCSLILTVLLASVMVTDVMANPKFIDFNGDHKFDLAIGAPGATVLGPTGLVVRRARAGSVTVTYGCYSTLACSAFSQLWTENSPGVPLDAQEGDEFGYALAAADFNNDNFTDLAIGVPGRSAVIVLYGAGNGLIGSHIVCGNPCPPQPTTLRMAPLQQDDRFGSAMVAGLFNDDEYWDLAVGAPYHDLHGLPDVTANGIDAGAVRVFYGSPWGLRMDGSLVLTETSFGSRSTPQKYSHFGAALAAGNFGAGPFWSSSQGTSVDDERWDLAIGIPDKDSSLGNGVGGVAVIYGSAPGLSTVPDSHGNGGYQYFAGGYIEGRSGFSLAVGDFGNSSNDDLAIGIPRRDVGQTSNVGAVQVLYGTHAGLAGSQYWNLEDLGLTPQPNQRFGWRLAAGKFKGLGEYDDLAVGVPGRPLEGLLEVGIVVILSGSKSGISSSSPQFLRPFVVQEGLHFGTSLTTGRFTIDLFEDLAIGIPTYPPYGAPPGNLLPEYGEVDFRFSHSGVFHPSTPDVALNQNAFGGHPEAYGHFGFALSK